jgi:TPR repeat protein
MPSQEAVREAVRVPVPAVPRDEVEGYLAKGERMLKAGDVAAARLFFARAAEAGDARGALAMARTHDPEALRRLPVYGMQPDPAEAARWYAKAKDLGATDLGATAAAR